MKILTQKELVNLVNEQGWTHETVIETVETINGKTWGWAAITSKLDLITIEYTETWDCTAYTPESFESGTEGCQEFPWKISGAKVVDDDGDAIELHESISDGEYAIEHFPDAFSKIDYSEIKEELDYVNEFDVSDFTDLETITLDVTGKPNVRFTGVLIHKTATSSNPATGTLYSGTPGCWTELYLYRTITGKAVCYRIERTIWEGCSDNFDAEVCSDAEEIRAFFGSENLAQDIYFACNIK